MPPTRTPDTMNVTVKHGGKTYPIDVDVTAPVPAFKDSIYRVTGVPADRMKVMLKGILKDDADLSTLGLKPGQVITVIGNAGPLPEAPKEQIVFVEDMDESELAMATRSPPGLVNLGNTCYLNSTLQALKTIPQLQSSLDRATPPPGPEGRLTTSIKNLFTGMNSTTESVPPVGLITALRTLAPQFAEQDHGHYAQQDADEAWTALISALRASLPGSKGDGSFVDEWMAIQLTKKMSCPEAPEEPPSFSHEKVLKLECNITINTNFLMSGIRDSLDQQVEKNSPTLNRTVPYNVESRMSRLPQYLAIHMVRFYWRRDIQKKAKIMRKVKYPLQLDVTDIMTDELREKVLPINSAAKNILKVRDDRAKIAKRGLGKKKATDEEEKTEDQIRAEEHDEVEKLVKESGIEVDVGSNPTAMYELCALVTHKGASADSGHYIGWTRKDDGEPAASGEEDWYKFDDDKVSVVPASKIQSMDGGGEDSVAYILLYRAINI